MRVIGTHYTHGVFISLPLLSAPNQAVVKDWETLLGDLLEDDGYHQCVLCLASNGLTVDTCVKKVLLCYCYEQLMFETICTLLYIFIG